LRKNLYWLYLILVVFHSNFALALNTTDIKQKLSRESTVNPKAVFYKIEALLADPDIAITLKAKLMVMQSDIAYAIDQPESIIKYSKLALATGLLIEPWHTRALISQSRGYYQRKQFKAFFATANMAVIKSEQSSLSNYKVAALVERAFAYHLLDDNKAANKDLNIAVKYLELLPSAFDKTTILERFSAVNKSLGHIKTARKYQGQANDIYKKLNSAHYLSIGYYNLGRIYQETQAWDEAGRLMLKSYRWALKDNNKLNQAFSLSWLSEYQNNLANHSQAKTHLNKAIIAADASTSERVKIHVRKNMASILCQNKEFQACKTLLVETIAFAKSYKMERDQVELMRILAETYYQLGAFEKAYLILKEADSI
jgi:tetratricopeptide (TPR) repeat protein